MTGRILAFDALDNFRDYGDYATAAGRRLRKGRLYRSAHHAGVSDADLERLAALDFGAVIDLRRPIERRRQPSRRAANFTGRIIESDLDEVGEAPHITFLKTADLTPDSGRRFMIQTYRELPFAPAHLDLFSRYFAALGEVDRPMLIHCAAGKDRTGMLAALTHHLLGVSDDDLMEDYLLTNTAVDLHARAPDIAAQLKAFTGREASHDAIVAFMGVEADYLRAAFEAMTARHGSVDGYMTQALGVDAGLRKRIAERLSA
jgi:protein tyrosine/serine phosphatase